MKKALIFLWIFMFAVLCSAQNDKNAEQKLPDFSGTWILDKSKTGPISGFSTGILVDVTMVIVHKDPQIKITRTTTFGNGAEKVENLEYFTDGRRIPVLKKNDENNFRTIEWRGKTLVNQATFMMEKIDFNNPSAANNNKKPVKIKNKSEWKLSKDGKTLTEIVTGGTLPGVPDYGGYKSVYRLKE
ncbi:MAG: hypothetical protein WA584_16130 [Pyrinomonadaceae bacterium]